MVKENSWEFFSPDNNIRVNLELAEGRLSYTVWCDGSQVLNPSALGILRNDADLSTGLSFVARSETIARDESVTFLTGKQLKVETTVNDHRIAFANIQGQQLQLEIKMFNNGLALRYVFPETSVQEVTIEKDLTEFSIPSGSRAWLQPYDRVTVYSPGYEQYFHNSIDPGMASDFGHGWCFPALFETGEQWLLISEGGIDGNFSGTHLDCQQGSSTYFMRLPETDEAKGLGDARPFGTLPWQTSWKTLAIGDLNAIVKSDLVKLVSAENRLQQTSWIKPGRVSWSWLTDHPSPRNFEKQKQFIDLAAEMGWEYSLVDANWDQMEGGSIGDLVDYAKQKGVGILMWYNSGGPHNEVTEAPRNIMDQSSARRQEFERLHQLGVRGVKIDFFQSDKQFLMELYKEILEDAAEFEIMVNFHGCTIPRGWSRTYPHLMTMEAVRGGECYSFDGAYAARAPELNTILPFTRNVVGSMDYTPVIFSNLVTPHLTSYGHEIALSVVFESGLLHFGDGINAYQALGPVEKKFLKDIPVTWDQLELIDGTPGKDVIMARRKGKDWYIGGINGEVQPKSWIIDLSRFAGAYQVTAITDGQSPDQLISFHQQSAGSIPVEVLPYGGFVMKLSPLEN